MKKTVFILCALSLLCSCMKQDETQNPASGANSLTAFISDNSTRAILIDNPGVKVESFWEDGDAISVFGAGASNKRFSITAADISGDGKTAEFKSAGDIPAGDLVALSPYSANATSNGTEISFIFPAVQHLVSGHGVPQADPQANIMVGRGSRATGVRFTNVMSILKTGMCFEQATVLRSIEFRDLSGSSVSGQAVIRWSGSTPSAEFSGQGGIITLDLGEDGLTLEAGEVRPFYLIVPARNYTKGFEITFVTKSGDRIVKVSGTKMGKELCSGVLYTVGDIDSKLQIPGAKSVLKPNATVMTADKLELIQITNISNSRIYTDGQYLEGPSGAVLAPEVTAIVHRDLQPAVGNWLLFDQYTSDMPKGALLKIKSCKQLDPDHFEIWAVSDPNVAAPFEELVAGTPLYDEAGNELKDGGFEIDASQIESIVDRYGNPVEFSLDGRGDLVFDAQTTGRLLATRAAVNHTFTTPSLSKTLEGRGCEMTVGARMSLGMKAALGIVHGEFQYIHMVCKPKIEINASFSIKGEASLDESFHFITLKFTPIVVAPGFICIPQLEIWGKLGVGGELEFQTSLTYSKDLGSFGLSYNRGDGITVRHSLEPNSSSDVSLPEPHIGGLTGTIYAATGLQLNPGISVYGLLSCGVKCDCTLKFGFISNGTYIGRKFALTPEVALSPFIYSLG
ncbi:MAG: fimbrillin family protein, partial [Bacteroidales bacterium]|nr:fimbrillin family protein [Bacteroidales bacterium]